MGQQYANNVHKNKNGDSQSVVEFVHGYMKSFSAEEQLAGIVAFTKLWNDIPSINLNLVPKSLKF